MSNFKPNPTDITSSYDTKGTTDAAFLENTLPNLTFGHGAAPKAPPVVASAPEPAEPAQEIAEEAPDEVVAEEAPEVSEAPEAPEEPAEEEFVPVDRAGNPLDDDDDEEDEPVTIELTHSELVEKTVPELKELAEQIGLEVPKNARKANLISLISEASS